LVSPITGFAFSIVGTLTGSAGTANQLLAAATSLTGVVSIVLSPVDGVLSGLLGGNVLGGLLGGNVLGGLCK
jgi:hypothetical protein